MTDWCSRRTINQIIRLLIAAIWAIMVRVDAVSCYSLFVRTTAVVCSSTKVVCLAMAYGHEYCHHHNNNEWHGSKAKQWIAKNDHLVALIRAATLDERGVPVTRQDVNYVADSGINPSKGVWWQIHATTSPLWPKHVPNKSIKNSQSLVSYSSRCTTRSICLFYYFEVFNFFAIWQYNELVHIYISVRNICHQHGHFTEPHLLCC